MAVFDTRQPFALAQMQREIGIQPGILPANVADYPLATGQKYGLLSTGCRLLSARAGSNKSAYARNNHRARADITEIAIKIPNRYVDRAGTKLDLAGEGAVTVGISIEYPAGTYTRFYFRADVRGVAPAGQDIMSDFMPIAIPAGAEFWTKIFLLTSGNVLLSQVAQNALTGEQIDAAATPVNDRTMTASSASVGSAGIWPVAIIGRTTKRSVVIYGDSIAEQTGDTYDASGLMGIVARAIGGEYPHTNLAQHGDSLAVFRSSSRWRLEQMVYGDDAVSNYGNNDISNGRTLAQIQDDLIWSWVAFRAAGAKRAWQLNYLPRTNSSNVALAGWGPGSVQAQANAWLADGAPMIGGAAAALGAPGAIRAGSANHPLTGIVDVASIFQNGDSGVWSNTTYQADWIHPSQAGNLAVAASNRFDAFKAAA